MEGFFLFHIYHILKIYHIYAYAHFHVFFFGRFIIYLSCHVHVNSPLSLSLGSRGTWFALRCLVSTALLPAVLAMVCSTVWDTPAVLFSSVRKCESGFRGQIFGNTPKSLIWNVCSAQCKLRFATGRNAAAWHARLPAVKYLNAKGMCFGSNDF